MSTRERVQELIGYVRAGRIPEAIEKFYGDGVTMQENRQPPTVGKAANLVRERAFGDSIERWHEVSARSVAVDGDHGGLAADDALAFDVDQGRCRTEIDGEVVGKQAVKPVKNHRLQLRSTNTQTPAVPVSPEASPRVGRPS